MYVCRCISLIYLFCMSHSNILHKHFPVNWSEQLELLIRKWSFSTSLKEVNTRRTGDLIGANNLCLWTAGIPLIWLQDFLLVVISSHNWVTSASKKCRSPSNFIPWKGKAFYSLSSKVVLPTVEQKGKVGNRLDKNIIVATLSYLRGSSCPFNSTGKMNYFVRQCGWLCHDNFRGKCSHSFMNFGLPGSSS